MTAEGNILPAEFSALEPFVAQWALPTTAERAERRDRSSAAERERFYAAAQPLLPAALAHLDDKRPADFDACERNLMNLMLGLIHASLAIEVQEDAEDIHRDSRRTMKITRSIADIDR